MAGLAASGEAASIPGFQLTSSSSVLPACFQTADSVGSPTWHGMARPGTARHPLGSPQPGIPTHPFVSLRVQGGSRAHTLAGGGGSMSHSWPGVGEGVGGPALGVRSAARHAAATLPQIMGLKPPGLVHRNAGCACRVAGVQFAIRFFRM